MLLKRHEPHDSAVDSMTRQPHAYTQDCTAHSGLTRVAAGVKARAVASKHSTVKHTADADGDLMLQWEQKNQSFDFSTATQQFVAFIAAIMVSYTAAVLVLVSCVHVHGFLPVAPLLKPFALRRSSNGLVMSSSDVVPQQG